MVALLVLHGGDEGFGYGAAANILYHHVAFVGMAGFCQREKLGEVGGFRFRVGFPETGFEVRENLWRAARDWLDVDVRGRADFAHPCEEAGEVHDAFAERNPLDGYAALVLIDDGIAEMDCYGVGAQDFERGERVFENEYGIAGVEVGADEFPTGAFDERAGFPGLEIFVILDCYLQAGIHGGRADGAEELNHGLNVLFSGAGRKMRAIGCGEASNDGGAERGGAGDSLAEIADGGIEAVGGFREHCAGAGFDMQAEALGVILDFGPVGGVHGFGVERILKEQGIELEACSVIEKLNVVPLHGSQAVAVQADGNLPGGRGGELRSGGGRECVLEEIAAIHRRKRIMPRLGRISYSRVGGRCGCGGLPRW